MSSSEQQQVSSLMTHEQNLEKECWPAIRAAFGAANHAGACADGQAWECLLNGIGVVLCRYVSEVAKRHRRAEDLMLGRERPATKATSARGRAKYQRGLQDQKKINATVAMQRTVAGCVAASLVRVVKENFPGPREKAPLVPVQWQQDFQRAIDSISAELTNAQTGEPISLEATEAVKPSDWVDVDILEFKHMTQTAAAGLSGLFCPALPVNDAFDRDSVDVGSPRARFIEADAMANAILDRLYLLSAKQMGVYTLHELAMDTPCVGAIRFDSRQPKTPRFSTESAWEAISQRFPSTYSGV